MSVFECLLAHIGAVSGFLLRTLYKNMHSVRGISERIYIHSTHLESLFAACSMCLASYPLYRCVVRPLSSIRIWQSAQTTCRRSVIPTPTLVVLATSSSL